MSIQDLCNNHDMTYSDLAERVGVTPEAISQYATGKRTARLDIARRIADVFKTTLDEVYANENKAITAAEETNVASTG